MEYKSETSSLDLYIKVITIIPYSIFGIAPNILFGYVTYKRGDISRNLKCMLINLCVSNIMLLLDMLFFAICLSLKPVTTNGPSECFNGGNSDLFLNEFECIQNLSSPVRNETKNVTWGSLCPYSITISSINVP